MPLQSIEQEKISRLNTRRRKTTTGQSLLAALAATVFLSIGAGSASGSAHAEGSGVEFVYTADEYGNSVSAIDLRNRRVVTTPIPIEPHNIQISADGNRLLAVGNPADEDHGHAGKDEGPGAREKRGLLVVLDPDDLAAGPLATIPVGDHPAHVVVDRGGKHAFVTNAGDDAVAVVDLAKNAIVRTIATGRYPHGLRISPDGQEAYVATVEDGSVSVIDTASLTEAARISVGAAPVQVGFLPDGSRAYVSLRDENRVAVIDTATRQLVGKIEVGRNPIQVYATPDGQRVYVANQGSEAEPDDTVSVIDVTANRVVETIRTGRGAHGVVVSDNGTRVFVTNIVDGTVSVIDEASRTVTANVRVGKGPNGVTFRTVKE